ncbi:MAG TPA: ABC transporter substrate-binding protein [Chloroflexota bacterium]
MLSQARRPLLGVVALVLCAACSSAAPAAAPSAAPQGGAQEPFGTISIAWPREPGTLAPKFLAGSGAGEYSWLFSSALAVRDLKGTAQPMLARELPTQAGGGWVIYPDGSMITTYPLRENARWHDGAPITAADYVFAYRVYTDPAMPVGVRLPEALMSSVEAPDDHTLVINWKELYLNANALGYRQLHPLPSHLLAEKYRANHDGFATGLEWTSAFIGSGPFKVENWEPGSFITARANREFFLGSPKIDRIDIRLISDPNTVLATLLAGELDMVSTISLDASHMIVARDQWESRGEGYLTTWSKSMSFIAYQFREVPSWQRAVTDLRVRQALSHALDRQAMTNVITLGLGPVADAYVAPNQPEFANVDRAITKYAYDPRRAAALLADAGWQRSGATGPLTNAAGQSLDLEVRGPQEALIIADYWKAAGINSTPYEIPKAVANDQEFLNSFSGADTASNTISQEEISVVSLKLPKAELGWLGSNRGSFVDPEVDRLFDIITTSLNPTDRSSAIVGVHKRISELVPYTPTYYSVNFVLTRNQVRGPFGEPGGSGQSGFTWNAWEWELAR